MASHDAINLVPLHDLNRGLNYDKARYGGVC